jgi:hypothetical protein
VGARAFGLVFLVGPFDFFFTFFIRLILRLWIDPFGRLREGGSRIHLALATSNKTDIESKFREAQSVLAHDDCGCHIRENIPDFFPPPRHETARDFAL